jgi:hypothetical protein
LCRCGHGRWRFLAGDQFSLNPEEGIPTDFVLVLVLVLETILEESDYENEDDDEDDPASVFPALFFQPLASDFRASLSWPL